MRRRGNRRPARRRSRQPATPARRLPRPGKRTWIALALAVAAGGAALGIPPAIHRIAALPGLAVREIRVEGASRAEDERIRELAAVAPGDRWLTLDARAIRFRVESHPWIARLDVRRPRVGRVVLRVTERIPVARVRVKGKDYGLARDLRVLPNLAATDSLLPVVLAELDDARLTRGVAYAQALRDLGLAGREPLEVAVGGDLPDRIRLPRRGFSARIEEPLPPRVAARNVAAFLETLDEKGAFRGTLRLISAETAVWEAAA